MAKKDRLKSLIGAITDSPKDEEPQSGGSIQETAESPIEDKTLPSDIAEELGIDNDMVEKLNIYRLNKVGRPKGRGNGKAKPRENRATFIVSKEIVRKLKYISLAETRLYKDVIEEALSQYIKKWERANGAINLPQNNKQ